MAWEWGSIAIMEVGLNIAGGGKVHLELKGCLWYWDFRTWGSGGRGAERNEEYPRKSIHHIR